ncbi:PepSY-associated TM helix domain-containing protein [Haloferula chungangensis]|uniref:PepSY-associated TM helix domain-containing protein n=1 Tax=Haloferula chungangensis TaxID=1048331 RepID=A0ABW2LBJ4_9BACT
MQRFPLLRKVLFWAHLAAGLSAGVFIFLMAASGIILSFERQITEAADGYKLSGGERLELPALHAKLLEAEPEARPTGIQMEASATAPAVFQFGRERSVFIDPYNGQILGEGAVRTRAFFKWVTGFHRWLAMTGDTRETGKAINSSAALVFFFILVSGLFLWIPKRWTRRGMAAISTIQPKLRGRSRDWNWHHTLGLWFVIPLLMTVSTGLVIAYPWANKMLFQAFGEDAPEKKGKGKPGGGKGAPEAPPTFPAGLDQAIKVATAAAPDWQQLQFSFPQKSDLTIYISGGHRGRPDLRQEMSIDLKSGEITDTRNFEGLSPGRRARSWARWLHTGEALGWVGQTISALAASATLVLIYTGFALSFRRFFMRRKSSVSRAL